jgi:hypothetical protein
MEPAQPPRDRFQFSLAWLLFWTTVCAILAGFARLVLAQGDRGFDLLLIFTAVGIWLAVTSIAVWHRIFARHRWKRVFAHRRELETLVRSRRAAMKDTLKDVDDNPPPNPP